jgi:hypothetical protein
MNLPNPSNDESFAGVKLAEIHSILDEALAKVDTTSPEFRRSCERVHDYMIANMHFQESLRNRGY